MLNEPNWPLDPWLAASLLQKSIRRGLPELAAYAATAYHRMRGKQAWRRLIIIAFEDIGIGAPELVAAVTRDCAQALRRTPEAGDAAALAELARRMAAAPKDRSADYLISAIKHHPDWERHRVAVVRLAIEDRIRLAAAPAADLALRATATWYASGVNGGGAPMIGHGDLSGLLTAFREAGVPSDIATAALHAVDRTKEPITLFLPLLFEVVDRSSVGQPICSRQADEPSGPDGLPLWVLDKHTAIGKRAIGEFARRNNPVRIALEEAVPEFRARDVALMAAFYVDAVELHKKLAWQGQLKLERAGMEADMLSAGCPREAAADIITAVRENLPHLDAIRARALSVAYRMPLFDIDPEGEC